MSASQSAATARSYAQQASSGLTDPHLQQLAHAVTQLANAVEELAREQGSARKAIRRAAH